MKQTKPQTPIPSPSPSASRGKPLANDEARASPSAPKNAKKSPLPRATRTNTDKPSPLENRSWLSIAAKNVDSIQPSFHMTQLQSITLPHVETPSTRSILTLSKARAILSSPASSPPNVIAAARALVNTVGPPIRLDPRTGAAERPPQSISTLALAPDSYPQSAFASFAAAQSALRQGAQLGSCSLPAHVIIPGVGRWTFVYFPTTALHSLSRVLAQVKKVYEDLQVCTTNLPQAALDLDDSAATGVARRLNREASFLRRRTTVTSLPVPLRIALSDALRAHARAIATSLKRSTYGVSDSPSENTPRAQGTESSTSPTSKKTTLPSTRQPLPRMQHAAPTLPHSSSPERHQPSNPPTPTSPESATPRKRPRLPDPQPPSTELADAIMETDHIQPPQVAQLQKDGALISPVATSRIQNEGPNLPQN